MAEKKKKETTQSTQSQSAPKKWSSTKILDCLAYFAIMCIAVALIFRLIFNDHTPAVADAFRAVGECLAYIISIWLAFYWTRRKKNIWWLIAWVAAAVTIIIIYIFALI